MQRLVFFLSMLFIPFPAPAVEGPCFDSRHVGLGAEIVQMPGVRAWAWQAIHDQIAVYTTPTQRTLIYVTPRPVLVAYIDFERQCRRLVEAEKEGKRSKAETPVVKYVMGVIRQEATARGLNPAAVLAAIFKQLMEE